MANYEPLKEAAEEGDIIIVTYDSTRGGEQTVTGEFLPSYSDLKIQRSDGQIMRVRHDGKIYSSGSHYPLTGSVKDVKLEKWSHGPEEFGNPAHAL